ncbi:MAG: CRISPR-associated protein Cas4 [Candidatus Bathyarchaeota archaeon]|nr:CRISPR-associated protein Cas4 [Candidatus Termiticorpusculum sp.]
MKTKTTKENTWLKNQQKLRTSDVAEAFISATDVKHYIYCPRLIYFDHVLHATPVFGSQQKEGKEAHEEQMTKELKRKDAIYYSSEFAGAEKLLYTTLCSDTLGLQGNVDLIIHTVRNEYIPVEYKNMNSDKGRVCMDHKYQLTAYALLIEETFNTTVKQGIVNYLPETRVLQFEITPTMKTHVKRIIGHIKKIIQAETLPPIRVTSYKCQGGCGHKQTCQP